MPTFSSTKEKPYTPSDFEPIVLGGSDIASLTYRTSDFAGILSMGMDGEYSAPLVDIETTEIPPYYEIVCKDLGFLWIYDDSTLSQRIRGEEITLYQDSDDFNYIIAVKNPKSIVGSPVPTLIEKEN